MAGFYHNDNGSAVSVRKLPDGFFSVSFTGRESGLVKHFDSETLQEFLTKNRYRQFMLYPKGGAI